MSVVTLGPDAPKIPPAEINRLASENGLRIPEDHVQDFSILLGAIDQAVETVLGLEEDSSLKPDKNVYPRSDIHVPEDSDDGAWATKCTAVSITPKSRLLRGKTVALKDNIALAGIRCTNGSEVLNWVPDIDAVVATRVMDASGIITGKATCENMCLEGVSDTSCTGIVHNPYAHGYSAGGSSSGCGRLVAIQDGADMAIGCDQGGSIRIPSSMCGIVGLKPTWGLVPYTGIIGAESTIDHCGPMARNVAEVALLLEVIAGPDGIDDRQAPFLPPGSTLYTNQLQTYLSSADPEKPLTGVRVAYLEEGFALPNMNPSIAALCSSAVEKLINLGANCTKVSIPSHTQAAIVHMCGMPIGWARQGLLSDLDGRKQHYLTDRIEASTTDSATLLTQDTFDKLGPSGQNLWLRYLFLKDKYPPQILQAKFGNLVRKITTDYDRVLFNFDVMVMPTLPSLPCKLFDDPPSHTPIERLTRNVGLVANTAPFNATGHPALSLPVGFLPHQDDATVKLPVGLQIVARKYCENDIFRVAAAFERAHDWKPL